MNKKWWIIIVVGVLGLVGYWYVAGQRQATVEAQETIETAVVRRDELSLTVDATGSLVPLDKVSVSFSSGGRVDAVFVEKGQVVEAGEILAQLDTDDLELQVAQAEAALAVVEVQLAQLLAPPRSQEIAVQEANLAAAKARLISAAAGRDQVAAGVDEGQIAAAESQLASAVAQQKNAYDMHERTMSCFDFDLPGGKERTICPALGTPEEQARYALGVADASLASAQARVDEMLTGADADQLRAAQANVSTAMAQQDAAQAQLDLLLAGPTEAQIETVQASVDDARVGLEQARLRLQKATLIAPVGGTVTFLDVQSGEIASANQPIIILSALATLEVDVNLDETDVSQVAVGQEVRVSVDAFPGVEMTGEVVSIADVAQNQSGVVLYPITVRLTSADQDLPARAGMTADVSIVSASQAGALIVPLRAVHTEGERAYVDRLAGGQAERVEVTLGLMTDTEIEITGGLSEGETVVVVARAGSGPSSNGGPMMFGGGQ
ncbi:MAG: efflux RND transporter periplasmic adaptor subunit [Chloroflexi bacterium]|nr:efflux RND transporter periplasmic adaptor subunit [Chloroflexota bacterium]